MKVLTEIAILLLIDNSQHWLPMIHMYLSNCFCTLLKSLILWHCPYHWCWKEKQNCSANCLSGGCFKTFETWGVLLKEPNKHRKGMSSLVWLAKYAVVSSRKQKDKDDTQEEEVCSFFVPLENFFLFWTHHHCRWRAANLTYALLLRPLNSGGSFACQTYCVVLWRIFRASLHNMNSPNWESESPDKTPSMNFSFNGCKEMNHLVVIKNPKTEMLVRSAIQRSVVYYTSMQRIMWWPWIPFTWNHLKMF